MKPLRLATRWVLDEPKRRQVARILAALVIVFVPTAWSVFPGWGEWNIDIRILAMVGWVLAAVVVVVTTDKQNRMLAYLMGDVSESVRLRKEAAGLRAITMLLSNPPDPFRGCRVSVFVADPGSSVLRHFVDSHPHEPRDNFEVGQGATGYAFMRNEQVRVRGVTVSDGSYGLDTEMCDHYKKYQVVISTCMWDYNNSPIGVLSTMATEDDGSLVTDDALFVHLNLAAVVGQLGIDLLRWGLTTV